MATTETPLQLLPLFCDPDSEGRISCTPYDSTFTTTYTENAVMSTTYLTLTTSEGTYASPIPPEPTFESPTNLRPRSAPIGIFFIIIIIVGGSLLVGGTIWLCARALKPERKKLYPGHQVIGMLGRSSTIGAQGGAAVQSGNSEPAVEMTGGLSSTNTPNVSGGAASPASSSATVAAADPVVGRIDAVLAGDRSEAGKASSGEGGMARYA